MASQGQVQHRINLFAESLTAVKMKNFSNSLNGNNYIPPKLGPGMFGFPSDSDLASESQDIGLVPEPQDPYKLLRDLELNK